MGIDGVVIFPDHMPVLHLEPELLVGKNDVRPGRKHFVFRPTSIDHPLAGVRIVGILVGIVPARADMVAGPFRNVDGMREFVIGLPVEVINRHVGDEFLRAVGKMTVVV